MTTWKELKNNLSISQEDISAIELEKNLIRTMVAIHEEKSLTQSQLVKIRNVKQLVIAQLKTGTNLYDRNMIVSELIGLPLYSGIKS